MPSGSAGRRYAQAVFELAKETNQLEKWADDLKVISQVFEESHIAYQLDNPKVTREKKINLISVVLKTEVSPAAFNLAVLLVTRHRSRFAGAIANEYTRLWNDLRGVAIAEVTTAVPVDAEQENAIVARLSTMTGKKITIHSKVDPTIIGGVIARIGDTLIDGSVKSRLDALRKSLV
jgi:F-type H+-transporting ATPase subunit delta